MSRLLFAAGVFIVRTVLAGSSGGDLSPVVGSAAGISEPSKDDAPPDVLARTLEGQGKQPGAKSSFVRD